MYLSAPSAHRVLRWDVQAAKVLEPLAVGDQTHGIAAVRGSPFVLVTHEDSMDLAIIEALTHAIVAKVPVSVRPHNMVLIPDGAQAWITSPRARKLVVIALRPQEVIGEVEMLEGPVDGL